MKKIYIVVISTLLSLVMLFTGCASSFIKKESETTYAVTYSSKEIADVVQSLDWGEGVEVLNVQTKFVSDEYYEELAYNSIGNYFFGYSSEELLALDGEAWFFCLNEQEEIAIDVVDRAQMLAEYDLSQLPARQNHTMRNFLIGGGVILVCATLSVFGSPAVGCIAFAAFKGAVAGAVIGAAVNTAGTAISYRLSEGTWEGSSELILESASQGFMLGAITGAVTGALSATNCFVEGTEVLLESGNTIAIEDVEVGMNVICADETTPFNTTTSKVLNTFSREAEETYIVCYGGNQVTTTAEHPFFVEDEGWVEAQNLTIGNMLISQYGEAIMVDGVEKQVGNTVVYNFEVEEYHTYFVGEVDYILVHNSCLHTQKAWSQERTRYWKEQGEYYNKNYSLFKNKKALSGKYTVTQRNIDRMLAGKAPLDTYGKSVQLHHLEGIDKNLYNYMEITRAEHYSSFRELHPWLYKGLNTLYLV